MRALVLLLGLPVLLATAGCSGGGAASESAPANVPVSPETPTGEEPPGPVTPEGDGSGLGRGARPAEGRMRVELWFVQGDALYRSSRDVVEEPRVARAALRALLSGPTPLEETVEVGTAIPSETLVRGVAIRNGVATVNLSRQFAATGEERAIRLRLAQVVYTVTQFPTVDKVRLQVEGEEVADLAGVPAGRAFGRKAFEPLVPPIVVTRPGPAFRVASPLRVAGTANVFEANVNVRVLGEDGGVVGLGFVTASCGTGCRGEFDGTVEFDVDGEQAGTVELFADDAADTGEQPGLVRIPVVLVPG